VSSLGPVPRFAHGSRVPGWDSAADLAKEPAAIPDSAATPVPDGLRGEIQAAMAKYPDRRSAIIPALHAAQRHHGWCSPEAMEQVAAVMRLTPAYCAAIATFYDMFDTEPLGRHRVWVCTNISCSLLGADRLLAAMEAAGADELDVQVRSFECLGACDIAPMASVDGEYVGPLTESDAGEIMAALREGREVLPDKQLRRRASVDPGAAPVRRTDAVLPVGGVDEDRPGPPAAIELDPPAAPDDTGDAAHARRASAMRRWFSSRRRGGSPPEEDDA
jgi:NADH-quinone oxidoreductase subunit E